MTAPRREDLFLALPEGSRPVLERLIAAAEDLGATLYLVGGPVRDLLLARPILDVDLMIAGPAGVDAKILAEAVASDDLRVRKHERFGTVSLATPECSVDVATLRRESYDAPGALPKVAPGTLEQDLKRRDFSINAMAMPLCGLAPRERVPIIDLCEGLADLEARQLRVLHDRSFHDDPTRVMRAARFAARFDMKLSRPSRSLLRDALRDGVFGAVSGDRLRREFEKIFADARAGVNPRESLARLQAWHVLQALEPGLELPRESSAPLRRFGKLLAQPPWKPREFRPWVAGLCLWLAPLAVGLRRRSIRRLSVRGEVASLIVDFPKDRDRWCRQLDKARGRGATDGVLRGIEEERLHALYASCGAGIRRRIVRWAAEDRDRRLPVNGSDLIDVGLSGAIVGTALARIRSAHLDAEVANREEALALAREILRRSRAGSSAKPRRPRRGGTRPESA